MIEILIAYGADPNFKMLEDTPLHLAAKRGDIRSLKCLMNSGRADINVGSGKDYNIPLEHSAIKGGNLEIIKYLKDYGCNFDCRIDDNNISFLSLITSPNYYPSTLSGSKNYIEIMKYLIKEERVDINGEDDEGNSIMDLIQRKFFDTNYKKHFDAEFVNLILFNYISKNTEKSMLEIRGMQEHNEMCTNNERLVISNINLIRKKYGKIDESKIKTNYLKGLKKQEEELISNTKSFKDYLGAKFQEAEAYYSLEEKLNDLRLMRIYYKKEDEELSQKRKGDLTEEIKNLEQNIGRAIFLDLDQKSKNIKSEETQEEVLDTHFSQSNLTFLTEKIAEKIDTPIPFLVSSYLPTKDLYGIVSQVTKPLNWQLTKELYYNDYNNLENSNYSEESSLIGGVEESKSEL